MRERKRENQTSSPNIVSFVLVEGVLKLGLPLTASIQLIGYLVKYGYTTAHLGGCFAAMNVLLFTITVVFEGVLFAIMIRYCETLHRPAVIETPVLKALPAAVGPVPRFDR